MALNIVFFCVVSYLGPRNTADPEGNVHESIFSLPRYKEDYVKFFSSLSPLSNS